MINKIKKIKNYFYWTSKGEYKPQDFWKQWGKTFINDPIQRDIYPQHKWIARILNKEKPKALLEVGCGFGRNIKYILENYKHPLAITATDISSPMLAHARKYLKDYLKENNAAIKLIKTDNLDLPFTDRTFDMVLCHGVLMHIKPDYIKNTVAEVFRVTKNKLIVVEQNDVIKPLGQKSFQKINYYTYTYPYKSLFEEAGGKIEEFHRDKELDWFLIKANA